MRHRSGLTPGLVLAALAWTGVAGGASGGTAIAVLPTQNRPGDSAAGVAVDRALRLELSRRGRVIDLQSTRNALRRRRIRNVARAAPARLRLLGGDLGADWLVSTTLHDADRRQVPSMTLSVRVYSAASGELIWAGFQGGSGLDRRKLLGLGTIGNLESLAPVVVQDLLEGLSTPADATAARDQRGSGAALGTVAIVPFSGLTRRRATHHAETATEAARARLFRSGVDLVSPNRSYEVLRRQQAGRWGGVTAEARAALHETGGAGTILTGAVETYELGGSEFQPDPRVAVAMRLLDAATGRIVWTGSLERDGGDGQSLFGLGRAHSPGALTWRIMEALTQRLDREDIEITPSHR